MDSVGISDPGEHSRCVVTSVGCCKVGGGGDGVETSGEGENNLSAQVTYALSLFSLPIARGLLLLVILRRVVCVVASSSLVFVTLYFPYFLVTFVHHGP